MQPSRVQFVLDRLSYFLKTPLASILSERLDTDPERHVLELFKDTVNSVPGYRQFLVDRNINDQKINTFADFQSLPLLDKSGYIQNYSLPSRLKSGDISACDRLAVSSGSTGISTFWPRAMVDELDIALRFEQVFRDSFQAHQQRTLAVVCFPLGNWVGGIFTTSCCWHLALKGYPITVATPGNNPDEILRVVRELGPHFQQTVLLGYPPFIKDVIDTGTANGLKWENYRIKLVFAGEVFSEEWRSLMLKRVGSNSPCLDSASLYGTADGGVLGNETPVSIAIRRFLSTHPDVARQLFGESRLPTLVQYDPISRFFEVVEGGTLAISGDNGVPLIRYHIADRGGLMSYRDMMEFLIANGLSSLRDFGCNSETCPLPFVWVFGRADFTVSFYGANIYPENVTVGLEQTHLSQSVSGKFVMEIEQDETGSEILHIAVELLPSLHADSNLLTIVTESIRTHLIRLNSEFANYVPTMKQTPHIELLPFGDPDYFPVGIKHRYTRNSKNNR